MLRMAGSLPSLPKMNYILKVGVASATMLLALPSSASSPPKVAPAIHQLCIEAKDYIGCVRAMTEGTGQADVRSTTSQGADAIEGNQCPAGFAYIGGGNCQEVRCEYNSAGFNALGHDRILGGKKDISGKDVWGCKYSFWHGAGVLRLSGGLTRTSNNPACPEGEPAIGFNSTCQTKFR
jgi:hypothetical protein